MLLLPSIGATRLPHLPRKATSTIFLSLSTRSILTRRPAFTRALPTRPQLILSHHHKLLRSHTSLYSTVVLHNAPRSRLRRFTSFLIISTVTFGLGFYVSLTYSPPILTPLIMGSHIPTDEETLSLYTPPDDITREIDEHIKNCALAQSLRADPSWKESRPHLKMPDAVKQHNLTAGTLSGPSMIAVPPYYFNKRDGSEMVQIFYVGTDVSGHPGIVHGGFIATMMDEGLARCAFPAMQNKVGVTANLKIDYRRPTMPGQFLVLRAKTTKVEGRKAWSEGWLESLGQGENEDEDGNKIRLVEASALFVEPKHANVLKSLYRAADGA